MKPFFLALAFAVAAATPVLGQEQTSIYMGKASTGEPVWYNGARAQCGDLPHDDECWKNPMVVYTIGSDHVTAIPDCKKGVFKEVWMKEQLIAKAMRPASQAIRSVLETACNSVNNVKTELNAEQKEVQLNAYLDAADSALRAGDLKHAVTSMTAAKEFTDNPDKLCRINDFLKALEITQTVADNWNYKLSTEEIQRTFVGAQKGVLEGSKCRY